MIEEMPPWVAEDAEADLKQKQARLARLQEEIAELRIVLREQVVEMSEKQVLEMALDALRATEALDAARIEAKLSSLKENQ